MSQRTIFSTTPSSDWVRAATQLSNNHGFDPVYWIAPDELISEIESRFPDCVVHNNFDSIQGRPADEYASGNFLSKSIDEELLDDLARHESIVLKMMDRLDPGNAVWDDLTYGQRVRHYHRLVGYWNYVLNDIDADVAVFGSSPHLVSDYVLYVCCEYYGIETLIFTHTSLPKTFYVRDGVHSVPDLDEIGPREKELSDDSKQYIESLRSEYSEAEPEYMSEDRRQSSILAQLSTVAQFGKEVVSKALSARKPSEMTYLKQPGYLLENSMIKNWEWFLYRIRAYCYRQNLKHWYQELACAPDLSQRYVFYALHYQPERTTSPEAGMYVHQYLAISQLSESLPDDVKIYVKEHPSQFSTRLKGEQGRSRNYYTDIMDIPQTQLITLDTPVFDLIDNSIAVATGTGTAGWEAIVRGTPALTFGSAWYQPFPGCYHTNTSSKLREALEEVLQQQHKSRDGIIDFATSIEEFGFDGFLSAEDNPISIENNSEVLAKAILESTTSSTQVPQT